MEEIEDFELEQEVDGTEPEVQEVEYHDQDELPSAVDDAADVMSEYDPVPEAQDELPLGMENDEEPVRELINQITTDDLVGAEGSFKDILADKVASALDNKKVELANSVYNGIDADNLEIDPETEIEDAEDPISDETTDSIEEN
tara:strand:- start:464 stop:895 length:432 start_codon:yes stop_codon:yes gene_type:complete